jgi:hypothetical protein
MPCGASLGDRVGFSDDCSVVCVEKSRAEAKLKVWKNARCSSGKPPRGKFLDPLVQTELLAKPVVIVV